MLPNPEALTPKAAKFYEDMGLNSRQVEIVASATPKREYYVLSPEGRRLFDMELGPYALSFVGASGAEDIARVRALHREFGSEWAVRWLKERGVFHENAA
jgi:type IV secretion system protein VirB4